MNKHLNRLLPMLQWSLLVAFSSVSFANTPPTTNPLLPKISLNYGYLDQASIQDSGGKFSNYSYDFLVQNALGYFGYTQWDLDWYDVDQLPFGNGQDQPINHLHKVSFGGKMAKSLSKKARWINVLGASSAYEVEMDDSYSVNLRSFVLYQYRSDVSLMAGAMYNYHPVRSRLYPVLGLAYRAKAKQGFSAVIGFPRLFVAYGLTERWKVSSGISYRQFMAKLSDDSAIEQQGYAELQSWKGDVMLSYQSGHHWGVDVFGHYSADYRFAFYNRQGHRQDQYEVQPTWGGGLKVRYQF
ncbi:hypothetical protein P8629_05800 [Hydrogenovibrio sp. 3SP14C1]|uniref:hypothetical protein n=1 Tax=Hydrogenovibrio sp. 3SP14C1 TaxID=3038774 RepID=UPI002415A077|nr:hypothetical protein [Hydrogenovibrio sp. 3SP14C1]MDG4812516.1 hypothetical protein [Hydrogenovibrio sp. 3SP14C1]